jgi:hypothetical protein
VRPPIGRVAELADALDLGSSGATRGGSTPPSPTTFSLHWNIFAVPVILQSVERLPYNLIQRR